MSERKKLEYKDLDSILHKPIRLYKDATSPLFLDVKIGTDGYGRYEFYLASNRYDYRENVAYNGKMLDDFYYEML